MVADVLLFVAFWFLSVSTHINTHTHKWIDRQTDSERCTSDHCLPVGHTDAHAQAKQTNRTADTLKVASVKLDPRPHQHNDDSCTVVHDLIDVRP